MFILSLILKTGTVTIAFSRKAQHWPSSPQLGSRAFYHISLLAEWALHHLVLPEMCLGCHVFMVLLGALGCECGSQCSKDSI